MVVSGENSASIVSAALPSPVRRLRWPAAMAASGHEQAEAAHVLAAQSLTAEAPNDSRAGTQPPGSPAADAAVATATEAPAEAAAESPADARADSSSELRPPPPTAEPVAEARAAPLEPPVAAPPQAAAAPGLQRPARPQPQPRPRPRPRPRTSDGGRLTASSPSAQLKANSTSLWRAAEHGDVGRLRMLLDAGCDIDAPCPDPGWRGKSALAAAVDGGEPAAVRFLLQRGADPNRADADGDRYPLHWASAFGDQHQCAELLLMVRPQLQP